MDLMALHGWFSTHSSGQLHTQGQFNTPVSLVVACFILFYFIFLWSGGEIL